MSFNGLQKRLNQTISHARLEPRLIPGTEVKLHLLSDDYPRGPLPHEEMLAVLNEPAYWAFCWASGQVLARFVLEQRELFAGKTVVGMPVGTIIRGNVVMENGVLVGEPIGQPVRFVETLKPAVE